MPRITPLPYRKYIRFLEYIGCRFSRQKGSHLIYERSDLKRPVVFQTGGEVPVFHLRTNLRTRKMTPDEYASIIERL